MPPGVGSLAVTSRFRYLSLMTSRVGVSTWMCDGLVTTNQPTPGGVDDHMSLDL